MEISPLKHFIEEEQSYCYGCKEYHPNIAFKKDNSDETGLRKYCIMWDWIINQLSGAMKRNCERNRKRILEGKRKLEFSIDDTFIFNQFIKQNWRCFYTGEEFDYSWHQSEFVKNEVKYTPTLDRIDNEYGYTPKNTVISVKWFNSMKSNRKLEDLSNYIRNHYTSLEHANNVILKLLQK